MADDSVDDAVLAGKLPETSALAKTQNKNMLVSTSTTTVTRRSTVGSSLRDPNRYTNPDNYQNSACKSIQSTSKNLKVTVNDAKHDEDEDEDKRKRSKDIIGESRHQSGMKNYALIIYARR